MAQETIEVESKSFSGGTILTQKRESLWLDAWRRLVRNRAAVVGIVTVVLLILMAIFALKLRQAAFRNKYLLTKMLFPNGS